MRKIIFSKEIYTVQALKATIKEFRNLARLSLIEKKTHIHVRIDGVTNETRDVFEKEFANYALAITVQNLKR